MNDADIRRRLRAAIGESTYAPDLPARAAARLEQPLENPRGAWLLAVTAAALAIALVATIVLGSNALRHRASVPLQSPPPSGAPVTAACAMYSQLNSYQPSVKMWNTSVGWAAGGLKTTDGGVTWHDMSPSALRAGMDSVNASNTVYPPGYKDFDLDAMHEWEFRTYSSSTTCIDHGIVFVTSDGGQGWKQSQPISFGLPSGWGGVVSDFQFVDVDHGFLAIQAGPWQRIPGWGTGVSPDETLVYATTNGGSRWELMSAVKPSDYGVAPSTECTFGVGNVTFASTDTGWIDLSCGTQAPEMLASRDAGKTWAVTRVSVPDAWPLPPCPCTTQMAHVFDATDFVITVQGGSSPQRFLTTSDGGTSWRSVTGPPPDAWTVDFVDAAHWWAISPQPGWQKGSIATDWLYRSDDGGQTWTVVASSLPVGFGVEQLLFVDTLHAIVVQPQNASNGAPMGPGQEVWTTDDGGHTWKKVADNLQPQ